MEKLDAVVAAVGAVVLVVALGGAAFYGGNVVRDTYVVSFSTATEELAPEDGDASAGEGFSALFNVTRANLTEVLFEVTFTGDAAVRATDIPVVVVVTGPDNFSQEAEGTLAAGSGASVVLSVPLDIASVPDERNVVATSVDDALARTDAGSTLGTGEWRVTARADPAVAGSETVTASIVPVLTYYAAVAAPQGPLTTP